MIRLITDENISWRLKRFIPDWTVLPANEIDRGRRLSDVAIWNYAQENNYHILTFDEDFSDLQNLLFTLQK